jgi:inner membrane protein
MDNLTHTFVGLALAETGLKRRTALGTATLAIGANFPDIDVIAVPLGKGFEWRRGSTHGFLALAVLPFVLAGIMWLSDRYIRRRNNHDATPADFRQLVILSVISIATHPILDFMNEYGMRWLMPFVDRWYYGDGLYIVDIWLLAALVIGVFWSRRDRITGPARFALGGLALYTTAMLMITGVGRQQVAQRFPGKRIMVTPSVGTMWSPIVPVPWRRNVLIEDDTLYRFASYSLFDSVRLEPSALLKGDGDPAVALARQAPEAQGFLGWARFPLYRVTRDASGTVVRIADARYSGDAATGWASVEVRLP